MFPVTMLAMIAYINKYYHFVFYELADGRSRGYFLIDSPFLVIGILSAYVYFVTNIGPKLMKNRAPFNLETLMIWYNLFQIIINVFIFEEAIRMAWGWKYNWLCEPVDISPTPENIYITRLFHLYFLVKMIDLLDTVFMVLRKRLNHVSFLHVYHHAGMCALTWGATKYLPGGHSSFLGLVNSFVHTVMYTYYLVTALYPRYKEHIWWKKHLTQLQMIQFLLIGAHSLILLFQPNCGHPKFVVFIVAPQNIFMFFLFWDFYKKAYLRRKRASLPLSNDHHSNYSPVNGTASKSLSHIDKLS